jgi:hypothetical protein
MVEAGRQGAGNTEAALTTATLLRRATMADDKLITIPFDLPRNEWSAFAQFCKRIDYSACARFASPTVTYNGRKEGDVIWSAVCTLQRQLAEAGFAPR